jgi:hypothetical protein
MRSAATVWRLLAGWRCAELFRYCPAIKERRPLAQENSALRRLERAAHSMT